MTPVSHVEVAARNIALGLVVIPAVYLYAKAETWVESRVEPEPIRVEVSYVENEETGMCELTISPDRRGR